MNVPLFPLNTVLFPGCVLDLQIFEARYLDMIGRCMKQSEGFGVVCIIEGEEVGDAAQRFSAIGCEALVRDFQQQSNGLLGIRVEGGRRFRVLQARALPDQLTVADVQWLDEQPDETLGEEHADLVALLTALAEHPMVQALGMNIEAGGQSDLANQLSYLLPLSPDQKLQLLALDAPSKRLHRLQAMIEQLQDDVNA